MDSRISIITLGVEDLDRAREFYRDGLGFPPREETDEIAFFDLDNITLALYPWDALAEDATVDPDGSGFRGTALAHNAPSKDAVDAQLQEAESAGATIVKEAQDIYWGGSRGTSRTPTTTSGRLRGTRTGSSRTDTTTCGINE